MEEHDIVHDHGSQFLSTEWHILVQSSGLTDIVTRVAYPQSNERIGRLHCTQREEGLVEAELADYQQASETLGTWQ